MFFTAFISFFFRYFQVKYLLKHYNSKYKSYLILANKLSLLSEAGFSLFLASTVIFRSTEHPFIHVSVAIIFYFCYLSHQFLTIIICHYLSKQNLQKYSTCIIINFIFSCLIMAGMLVSRIWLFWLYKHYNPENGLQDGLTDFGDAVHDVASSLQWLSLIPICIYYYITSIQMKNFKHLFNDLME